MHSFSSKETPKIAATARTRFTTWHSARVTALGWYNIFLFFGLELYFWQENAVKLDKFFLFFICNYEGKWSENTKSAKGSRTM